MKSLVLYLFFLCAIYLQSNAQALNADTLHYKLAATANDTAKLELFNQLSDFYSENRPDSSTYYAQLLIDFAKRMDLPVEEAVGLTRQAYANITTGNFSRSLQFLLSAISLVGSPAAEKKMLPLHYYNEKDYLTRPITAGMVRLGALGRAHQFLGILYANTLNNAKELEHYMTGLAYSRESGNIIGIVTTQLTLGRLYLTMKKPDSALHYIQQSYDMAVKTGYRDYLGSVA